jgi:hypothetical protein
MNERYLDDDAAGQKFGALRIRVEKDRIKAFAAEFRPAAISLRRSAGIGQDLPRTRGKRLAHRGDDHATSGWFAS